MIMISGRSDVQRVVTMKMDHVAAGIVLPVHMVHYSIVTTLNPYLAA
jgi:hypothetical protein